MPQQEGVYITSRFLDQRALDVAQAHNGGFVHQLADRFTGDFAQNDTLFLGYLPDHAVIWPQLSFFQTTALGGSVTLSLGLAADTSPKIKDVTGGVGISGKEEAFLSDVDVSSATNGRFIAEVALTDFGKPLYEHAGMDRSVDARLKVIATLEGGNPASGTVALSIAYTQGG